MFIFSAPVQAIRLNPYSFVPSLHVKGPYWELLQDLFCVKCQKKESGYVATFVWWSFIQFKSAFFISADFFIDLLFTQPLFTSFKFFVSGLPLFSSCVATFFSFSKWFLGLLFSATLLLRCKGCFTRGFCLKVVY